MSRASLRHTSMSFSASRSRRRSIPCCCLGPAEGRVLPHASLRAARVALASTLAALALCPDHAAAITDNQLLFLEAWRAVDKAYVDKTFNNQSWFRYREQAVKNTPMDSRKETYDAIRKMLATLVRPLLHCHKASSESVFSALP